MRRREFITLLGGAAAAWPLAAGAQQGERMRRIGVLMSSAADDLDSQSRLTAFLDELERLGWTHGTNMQIEARWGAGNINALRRHAADLVALSPDAILAGVGGTAAPLLQATRTVPIVFAQTIDPVGNGYVASLARPGGNATGFVQFEYSLSGKWPELLKEIAPRVARVAILRDPSTAAGIGQWAVIQATASSLGMEIIPIAIGDAGEIERAIAGFSREPNSGLIAVVSTGTTIHRELILRQAAWHRLPAVYPHRSYVAGGGLMSYGPDLIRPYKGAAGYVDRILRGEKPADLPVQAPIKYELAINLKTAEALGLDVPPSLLARADEVIE